MRLDSLMDISPYSLPHAEKKKHLLSELNYLVETHLSASAHYNSILKAYGFKRKFLNSLEEFPFLPIRLFKDYTLKSCDDDSVIKTLTSSGTTSQKVSKIYLDKETSALQTKALVKILQTYLGRQRLPMLLIETKNILNNRKEFSARGAGILGLSNFGKDHTYALDEEMKIDFEAVESFLERHVKEQIFIFGFTFMVWQYFYEVLKQHSKKLDFSNAILIHSGGWKKLLEKAVDNETFKDCLRMQTGIKKIYNFYGMVEQVGSIFMECEQGFLHAPIFSDLIIRDPMTLTSLDYGEEGLVEVFSALPGSYPGHVLLTEDIGTIHGEDDCLCGKKGKYFSIKGRLPSAELRGCSDTHAYNGKTK